MDVRELRFWTLEAMRANDRKEASMADAVRFGYHADASAYERYTRGLRVRMEDLRPETVETYREKWERLKTMRRG